MYSNYMTESDENSRYGYLLTYVDKDGNEIKELYGKYSQTLGYFFILSSQFRGSTIRNYNQILNGAYKFLSEAEYNKRIMDGFIVRSNQMNENYKCSYQIVQINYWDYKQYNYPKIEFEEDEANDEQSIL